MTTATTYLPLVSSQNGSSACCDMTSLQVTHMQECTHINMCVFEHFFDGNKIGVITRDTQTFSKLGNKKVLSAFIGTQSHKNVIFLLLEIGKPQESDPWSIRGLFDPHFQSHCCMQTKRKAGFNDPLVYYLFLRVLV